VVPGVFAVVGEVFCSPTDAGQGGSWPGRLRNLDRERVTILAGFYDEDWPKVWRFRLRSTGRRESGAHAMVREVR
jgi:hypothetical protein